MPEYEIDPNILGRIRLRDLKKRILRMKKRPEGFDRKGTGRRKFKDNDDQITYLKSKLKTLKLTYEELIKESAEVESITHPTLLAREYYKVIHAFSQNKKNKLSIVSMCRMANVSKSGYYQHVKKFNNNIKTEKDYQDELDCKMIQTVFNDEGVEKGARQIKMQVHRMYGVNMNLKRIYRIMRKFNIVCTTRKPKPMKVAMRAFKTTNYKDNILKRNFNQGKAKKVLLTDITYLKYAKEMKTAYLCTIKDATTKQILSWHLSESLELEIVIVTIKRLLKEYGKELDVKVMIHSDQGCHFTAYDYQQLLAMNNITQSMSRRGNCWDNAPQESFFSTFKCESNYQKSKSMEELITCIGRYIGYYNMRRPQWNLHKMTPFEYDSYLSDPFKDNLQLPVPYIPKVIRMGMVECL